MPVSNERYGACSFSNSTLRRRRGAEHPSAANSTVQPRFSSTLSHSNPHPSNPRLVTNQDHANDHASVYKHDVPVATIILPSIAVIFSNHQSPVPFIVTLYTILLLYLMDFYVACDAVAFGLWMACGTIGLSLIWEHYRWNEDDIWGGMSLFFDVLIIVCIGCWGTLQLQWLPTHALEYFSSVERTLHTMLPIASSAVLAHLFATWVGTGNDFSPHLFSALLYVSIRFIGKLPPSQNEEQQQPRTQRRRLVEDEERTQGHAFNSQVHNHRTILGSNGHLLRLSQFCLPTIIHTIHQRQNSRSTFQEPCSFLLIISTSYIFHILVQHDGIKGVVQWKKLQHHPIQALRNSVSFFVAIMIAFLSFQYQFLIPISQSISNHLHGRLIQSYWSVFLWFNCGVSCLIMSVWLHGKKDDGGLPVCGKFNNEIFHITIMVSIVLIGSAFPLPYDTVLLLATCVMTMGIFMMTKMLRFMFCSLLVNGTVLALLITNRFRFINHAIWIIPGYLSLPLSGFAFTLVILGGSISFVYGMAVRTTGGVLQHFVKTVDLPGLVLLFYTSLLMLIELALHFERSRTTNGWDQRANESGDVYPRSMIILTSAILFLLSTWLRKKNVIRSFTGACVGAMCLGKTIAALTETEYRGNIENRHLNFLKSAIVSSLLMVVVRAPYIIVDPIDSKTFEKSQKTKRGMKNGALSRVQRVIAVYCGLVLPMVIMLSVPSMLTPLVSAIKGERGCYNIPPQRMEIFGFSIAIWGGSVLCMLRFFLPHGGCKSWRKASFAALVLGVALLFVAPASPAWRGEARHDLFFSVSSLGTDISTQQGRCSWGLASAFVGILLSSVGPSRFKIWNIRTSKHKDDLVRTVTFSLLFGCGLSWFSTNLIAGNLLRGQMALVSVSSALVAFFHTRSAVLSYISSEKDFHDATESMKVSITVSFGVFFASLILDFAVPSVLELGPGTLPCILLHTCSLYIFMVSVAIRLRKKRTSVMKRLCNFCSFLSWITALAATYGCFGLVSTGKTSNQRTVMGTSTSVVLTIAASTLLSTIEINPRLKHGKNRRSEDGLFGMSLSFFSGDADRDYSIPVFFTGLVFIIISLYVILLRGLVIDVHTFHTDFLQSANKKESHHTASQILAKTFMTHKESFVRSSRLAACGFWTAKNRFGPLKHLLGLLLGPLTTWWMYSTTLLHSTSAVPYSYFVSAAGLNVVTLVLCKGIPSLTAAAFLALIVSTFCAVSQKRVEWRIRMSI